MKKLTVTIDETAQASITSLVAHFEPFVSTHAIASAALRIGLDLLAQEPAKLRDILRSAREVQG
jgi:hypothetical protein